MSNISNKQSISVGLLRLPFSFQEILDDPRKHFIFWKVFTGIYSYLENSKIGNDILKNTITTIGGLDKLIKKIKGINEYMQNCVGDISIPQKNKLFTKKISEKEIKTACDFLNSKQLDTEFAKNINELRKGYLNTYNYTNLSDDFKKRLREKYEKELSLRDRIDNRIKEFGYSLSSSIRDEYLLNIEYKPTDKLLSRHLRKNMSCRCLMN